MAAAASTKMWTLSLADPTRACDGRPALICLGEGSTVCIGREGDVVLDAPQEAPDVISRHHATIATLGGNPVLTDQSTNGCEVDGVGVANGSSIPLHDGAVVIFGCRGKLSSFKKAIYRVLAQTTFRYVARAPQPEAPGPSALAPMPGAPTPFAQAPQPEAPGPSALTPVPGAPTPSARATAPAPAAPCAGSSPEANADEVALNGLITPATLPAFSRIAGTSNTSETSVGASAEDVFAAVLDACGAATECASRDPDVYEEAMRSQEGGVARLRSALAQIADDAGNQLEKLAAALNLANTRAKAGASGRAASALLVLRGADDLTMRRDEDTLSSAHA